jgi:hypothetical protein
MLPAVQTANYMATLQLFAEKKRQRAQFVLNLMKPASIPVEFLPAIVDRCVPTPQ